MFYYQEGEILLNKEEYNKRESKFKTKHYNELSIHNEVIQSVIQKFKFRPYDVRFIYAKLRWLYWTSFDTLKEFEDYILSRINNSLNFDELVS